MAVQAVFFDFDGTLVDSAPDLVAAINHLRAELGEREVDFHTIAQVVSRGGRAMLRRAFVDADEARIETLLPRFLEIYAQNIAGQTQPYDGIENVLATLDTRGIPWGIVTNKNERLARAIVAALGWNRRVGALVGGDTLAQRKPDPAPLLHAAALVRASPAACIYVGDDARDIEAGRAAGMKTVAVEWGYLNGERPSDWGADCVIATPRELLSVLDLV